MMDLTAVLADVGRVSLPAFWAPVLAWTAAALPLYAGLRRLRRAHVLVHYHGALALLLALPVCLVVMPLAPPLAVMPFALPAPSAPAFDAPGPAASDPIPAAPAGASRLSETPPPSRAPIDGYAVLGLLTVAAMGLALYRLGRLAAQAWSLRALRSRLRPLGDARAERLLRELAAQVGLRRPVFLAAAPEGASPMTFGRRRPVVALPPELLDEPSELRTALLHELIHVRRGDYAVGWAVQLLAALFAAHPGVGLLQRRIDACRELSCDAEVLYRARLAPDRYARLLLRFSHTASPAAVSMRARPSMLKHRIQAMQYLPTNLAPAAFRRLSLSVAAVLFLVPVFLAACTSTESASDGLTPNQVRQLEAQVAYLRNELREVYAMFSEAESPTATPAQRADAEYARQRYALLQGMLSLRMQMLEEARMEAATAAWMERLARP